jgi:hypothetical protein
MRKKKFLLELQTGAVTVTSLTPEKLKLIKEKLAF